MITKEYLLELLNGSESLEEAAMNYIAPIENEDGLKVINFSGQDIKDAFIAGANWQKKHDQETIELAEDHAFLAGADWQREQMLKEAVEGDAVKKSIIIEGKEYSDWLGLGHSVWDKIVDLNWYGSPYKGEQIRIIIVKENYPD